MAHEMNLFGCLSQNLRLGHDRGNWGRRDAPQWSPLTGEPTGAASHPEALTEARLRTGAI